jgi:tetratricopeptide (TPR) repeat protein
VDAIISLQTSIQLYEELAKEVTDLEIKYLGPLSASWKLMGRLAEAMDEGTHANKWYQLAIEGFQKCLTVEQSAVYSDGLAWSHTHLGDLLWETDPNTAKEHYDKATQLRESLLQPGHLHNHAKLLIWRKDQTAEDLEQAVETIQRLLQESPENAQFMVTLGAAYCRLGSYERSIEILQKVDLLNPGGNSAHEFWLTLAHLGRGAPGDDAEAKKRFEQAVTRMDAYAPGHAELQELRAEIEKQQNASLQ